MGGGYSPLQIDEYLLRRRAIVRVKGIRRQQHRDEGELVTRLEDELLDL